MRVPNRARDTTVTNIGLCFPHLGEDERRALCFESLFHTACAALEMGKVWLWPAERACGLVREVQGGHLLREAMDEGRGAILIFPHLGNWEIFALHAPRGLDATYIHLPPRNEYLRRLLLRTRTRAGLKLAPAGRRGVAMLVKALGRGGLIGVLPDQVPGRGGGVYADFFSQPALTMTLPSRLLRGNPVKVLCGFAERLPDAAGFRINLQEADPDIHSPDLHRSVAAVNRTLETCVKQAVPQYQWEYKRFRHPPDGREVY